MIKSLLLLSSVILPISLGGLNYPLRDMNDETPSFVRVDDVNFRGTNTLSDTGFYLNVPSNNTLAPSIYNHRTTSIDSIYTSSYFGDFNLTIPTIDRISILSDVPLNEGSTYGYVYFPFYQFYFDLNNYVVLYARIQSNGSFDIFSNTQLDVSYTSRFILDCSVSFTYPSQTYQYISTSAINTSSNGVRSYNFSVSNARTFCFTITLLDKNGFDRYQDGYNADEIVGYNDGFSDGEQVGYNDGLSAQTNLPNSFVNLLFSMADLPIYIVKSLFSFDLFGISMFVVIMSLITGIIVIYLVKKFIH